MRLIGIGGAHIDRRGQLIGDYVAAASNPGVMREDIGGGTLNALRNAAQRSVECSLISVRGGDAAGEQVARAAIDADIADFSATFLDRATPTYTALLDRHGELIAGFADMGLYDLAFPKQLRRSAVRDAIARSDAVLCDANVPQAGLETIVGLCADKPIFAIAVSPAKVSRLRPILPRLTALFMNMREASALAGGEARTLRETVEALRTQGLQAGVITAGSEPLTLFTTDGMFTLQPPAPTNIADVTGAGDALAGATISAVLAGLPLMPALREGVAASLLAIESAQAVARLSPDDFAAKLALVPHALPMA